MPDFWGLKQHFPVMPLSRLDQKPNRSAVIWDITCDSDGEISFDQEEPLYLHDIDVKKEDYFIGFFLVGAYQETLGMKHNLFEKPTEVTVKITEDSYKLLNIIESKTIYNTLKDLGYNTKEIKKSLKKRIKNNKDFSQLEELLKDNSYLRTFINQDKR